MSRETSPAIDRPTASAFSREIVWPHDRFYWAVLGSADASSSATHATSRRNAIPSKDYLDSLFEEDLPLAMDHLHAVYAPTEDGRFIACAVPRALLAEVPAGTTSLRAVATPAGLGLEGTANPPELLQGEFEPPELVRERGRRWFMATAAMLVCGSLVCFGLWRRASHAEQHAQELDTSALALARHALPTATGPTLNLTSGALALKHELDDLRPLFATDVGNGTTGRTPDAASAMAGLLAVLPKTTSLRTDILGVTPTTITLGVVTDADPQVFLKGLAPPQGWTLDEPRLSALRGGSGTSLAIQMRRTAETQGTPGTTNTTMGAPR